MTDTSTETDARSILERARSAMSGLTTVEAAIRAVVEQLHETRSAVQPEDAVVEHALGALLTGGEVPDDIADRVIEIRRRNEVAMARAQILGPLEQRLQERLVAAHRHQADAGLAVLAVELADILNEARPVLAELHGVDDAADAIDANRVQPWRQAIKLVERHVELRGAQRVITAAALDPPDRARATTRVSPEIRNLIDNFGFVRDPAYHYPELGGSDRTEARTGTVKIFRGRVVSDSHTDAPVRPRPWLTGDSLADLRFLAGSDVSAWVPQLAALTEARAEHEHQQQADARAEAERRPGDDDPPFLRPGRGMPPPSAALLSKLAREELGEVV